VWNCLMYLRCLPFDDLFREVCRGLFRTNSSSRVVACCQRLCS
jgi:hypothetical protein